MANTATPGARGGNSAEAGRTTLIALELDRLTPEMLVERHGVLEAGERDGRGGRPAPTATKLSTVEEDVRNHVNEARQNATEAYQASMNSHQKYLSALEAALVPADVNAEGSRGVANVRTKGREILVQLQHAMRDAEDAETELHNFRQRHKRGPEAILDHRPITTKVALFVGLLLLEMFLNGAFISTRLAGGLAEGVTIAGTIALVNMFLSLILGRLCLPHMLHVEVKYKIFGILGAILIICALLALNLGVAHMRTVLSDGSALLARDAAIKAFERLAAHPFSLGNYYSIVLFLLGSICSTGGAYTGYGWDEPYPRYGAQTRRRNEARQRLLDAQIDAMTDLDECYDAQVRSVEAARDAIRQNAAEYRATVQSMTEIRQAYQEYLERLKTTLNAVVNTYRQVNTSNRNGLLSPSYFTNDVPFDTNDARKSEDKVSAPPDLKTIEEQACEYFGNQLVGINDAHTKAHEELEKRNEQTPEPKNGNGEGDTGPAAPSPEQQDRTEE